jgi:hypothetical protein
MLGHGRSRFPAHAPIGQHRRPPVGPTNSVRVEVIESHAFVLLPPFKFVIPECPERLCVIDPVGSGSTEDETHLSVAGQVFCHCETGALCSFNNR